MSRAVNQFVAAFENKEPFLRLVRELQSQHGVTPRCYTPMPMEELEELLHLRPSLLPRAIFVAGFVGASVAFSMQYFAMAVDYPLNIGGRPLNSWPAFMPITFELMVLFGAFTAFFGTLLCCRLPKLHQPVLESPLISRASQDRYVVVIALPEDEDEAEVLKQCVNDSNPAETEVFR